mgnify:CR=1 FL=1
MRLIKDTVSEAIKSLLNKIAKYNKKSLGLNGAKYIKGAGANPGDWFAIQGTDAAVLDVGASTFKTSTGMENFTGANITIPNGVIMYINATDIQLASGNAIAYKRV